MPKAGMYPLPADATLIRVQGFSNGLRWSALLDLEQWTASAFPGLAVMAPSVRRRDRMLALFRSSTCPLDIAVPELGYDKLSSDEHVTAADLAGTIRLAVSTAQGTLWLDTLPGLPACPPELSSSARAIPLALSFCRGHSIARLELLRNVRPGDVMLMSSTLAYVGSAGFVIASLTINQKGEMIMHDLNQDSDGSSHDSLRDSLPDSRHGLQHGSQHDPQQTSQHQFFIEPATDNVGGGPRGTTEGPPLEASIADIMVRVEFVLQRQVMKVGQLDRLFRGQVLQLDPEAEKQVELVANGVCLARGELVEFNGRLGVEVHHVSARTSVK